MKLNLALLAVGASAMVADHSSADFKNFKNWMAKHRRSYATQHEQGTRFRVWLDNLKFVREHNEKFARGETTYHMKMNSLADLMHHEYQAKMLAPELQAPEFRLNYQCPERFTPSLSDYPSSVDHRATLVTPVKDQGSCGSCWSFATTGSFEGALCKAGLYDCPNWSGASEQDLVDCGGKDNDAIWPYYDMGCNGGWGDNGFYTIQMETDGHTTEDAYPYVSGKTQRAGTCDKDGKERISAGIKTCVTVQNGSDDALMKALAEAGPQSLAIDAGKRSFQFYSGGVYDEPRCSSTRLNHAVLGVGYGTMDGKDHFIVKNSWGQGWGADGFIYMTRGSNQCGVAAHPVYPILDN